MKKGSITKFKLNPKKPPKTDWRAFDAMTEEQRHRAAVSDPDAPPATEAQLARARRVPTVRALRKKLNLTQEEFAARSTCRSGLYEIGSKARTVPTKPRKCC
jgi:putative transcriptional regulator